MRENVPGLYRTALYFLHLVPQVHLDCGKLLVTPETLPGNLQPETYLQSLRCQIGHRCKK